MRQVIVSLAVAVLLSSAACASNASVAPLCLQPEESVSILILEAQSVPTATHLPCIAELPIGWRFSGSQISDGETTLWLDHDRAGIRAVEVRLTPSCDVSSAVEVPPGPDEIGMRVYQEPTSIAPFAGSRFSVFEGGCITSTYRFSEGSEPSLVIEADRSVSTISRQDLVEGLEREIGFTLCGAGVSPCPG